MPATEAQIAANRKNALLSSGPKTQAGKERSRRNALKHGLTGEGVALPDEDAAEVAARFRDLEQELRPGGTASAMLLRRFAYLSVRLERCERLDTAVYSKRVRHADEDFVDHRMTQVEALASRLAFDPMTTVRRLQNTPEGIDWLVGHWGELREDLMNRERAAWTLGHGSRMERLLGKPEGNFRQPRSHALTEALSGFLANINPSEVEGLDEPQRVEWARMELSRMIDEEVERLKQARARLDPWKMEQDRLEATDRCLFDLQPAMEKVRKYEAATERAMYKALKEFRQMEAELEAARGRAETEKVSEELASSSPEAEAEAEISGVVAQPSRRTLPLSPQLSETIHFLGQMSPNDVPTATGYPGQLAG